MSLLRKLSLFFVMALFLCADSYAEVVVHLKSGKRIKGELVVNSDEFIKVKVSGLELTYFKEDVRKVEKLPESNKDEDDEVRIGFSDLQDNYDEKLPQGNYPVKSIKVKRFMIPQYGGRQNRNLNGIAATANKIYFATDNSWGECSYYSGAVDFSSMFIAPTKGYKIKAVASTGAVAITYDSMSNSIMLGKSDQYKLTTKIHQPSAMTWHEGNVYLADQKVNKIYKVLLRGTIAQIVNTYPAPDGINGLASDREAIYASSGKMIYKLDTKFDIVEAYKLNVYVNGLASGLNGELVACARGTNIIYLLSL